MLVDAVGKPVEFKLTGGEAHDSTEAIPLLTGKSPAFVMGDKAYDANKIIEFIVSLEAQVVIPPTKNRREQRDYDHDRYKTRNLVERFFNRLKQFRRIATRYEKTARNFSAMVSLGCVMVFAALQTG